MYPGIQVSDSERFKKLADHAKRAKSLSDHGSVDTTVRHPVRVMTSSNAIDYECLYFRWK
jgi:hypothetical protein